MTITHLLDETVTAERKSQIGNSDKYALSTVTSVKAHKQPLSDQKRFLETNVEGKQWVFYLNTNRDVQEGDRLRDSNGVEYKVTPGGVTERSHGSIDFLKVIAEQKR